MSSGYKASPFFCDERRERNKRQTDSGCLALTCITQLLLGSSAIGRVQVEKKKSQAIRGKLRLISCSVYHQPVGSSWRAGRGAPYDATGEKLLGSLALAGAGDAPRGNASFAKGHPFGSRGTAVFCLELMACGLHGPSWVDLAANAMLWPIEHSTASSCVLVEYSRFILLRS